LFESLFYDFVTLLAVVNPIEAAATFATLTSAESSQNQARIAARSSIIALIILVAFGFIGDGLLKALGIGFPAFRIAGGLLLLKVGFDMVFAKDTGTQKLAPGEEQAAVTSADPSVFPLAIPIITGPGALTTIVTLMSKRNESWLEVGLVTLIAVAVLSITFLAMRASQSLKKVLGTTGINAVGRVMGIIVSAIAIQLVVDGMQVVFPGMMH
jgi:multiple antibiotic resistance protein